MNRRDFSKALVAAPVIATTSQTAFAFMEKPVKTAPPEPPLEPPSSCTIIVNPRDGKFATEFEICVEQAFKNLQPEDVDGPIYFDPRTMYNKPWLMVPGLKDNTLTTPPDVIFRQRRFDIIDRAVDLRLSQYGKVVGFRPTDINEWHARRKAARQFLLRVLVTFRMR